MENKMKIVIKYCDTWNYLPNAQSARDEMLSKHPKAEIDLVVGSNGQFDIILEHYGNETIVFSKESSGRFPESGEAVSSFETTFLSVQQSLQQDD